MIIVTDGWAVSSERKGLQEGLWIVVSITEFVFQNFLH